MLFVDGSNQGGALGYRFVVLEAASALCNVRTGALLKKVLVVVRYNSSMVGTNHLVWAAVTETCLVFSNLMRENKPG